VTMPQRLRKKKEVVNVCRIRCAPTGGKSTKKQPNRGGDYNKIKEGAGEVSAPGGVGAKKKKQGGGERGRTDAVEGNLLKESSF